MRSVSLLLTFVQITQPHFSTTSVKSSLRPAVLMRAQTERIQTQAVQADSCAPLPRCCQRATSPPGLLPANAKVKVQERLCNLEVINTGLLSHWTFIWQLAGQTGLRVWVWAGPHFKVSTVSTAHSFLSFVSVFFFKLNRDEQFLLKRIDLLF